MACLSLSVIQSVSHSLCVSQNFNLGHNFCNIEDSNLIFGMHVYLMELHIVSGERSRSSFKVKGQNMASKWRNRGYCVSDKLISSYNLLSRA
jgi:hypothetical protein